MSFINSYTPPQTAYKDANDVYCNITIPASLETERIKLTPFISHLHAKAFYNPFSAEPNMSRWFPISWPTLNSFIEYVEGVARPDPAYALFAMLDKNKPDYDNDVEQSLAGIIGYMHISPRHRSLELGPVIILPKFQGTFVSSNAIGLMLKYALDVPSQGGMGFRRVAWTCSPNNVASIRVAEKMGLVHEGMSRWVRVVPLGKEANQVNGNERGEGPGWDYNILSLCWDDWEGGIREQVVDLMAKV